MSKEQWLIQLIKVGRRNVCRTYKSRYNAPDKVEDEALAHCKKYLVSKNVYLEHGKRSTYRLFAGHCLIGYVKITPIQKEIANAAAQKPSK